MRKINKGKDKVRRYREESEADDKKDKRKIRGRFKKR